ncbi:prolyl oligopeptidase family serine peptidase [Glaciecola sp. 1036]|uniref:S9 family peptidase n=1 Tax=Alteromonadaceae TaxID=72275 RepID=UPI003CFF5377
MKKIKIICISVLFSMVVGCTATATNNSSAPTTVSTNKFPTTTIQQQVQKPTNTSGAKVELSIEQIMSDPDWLGRQPENPKFAPLSNQVVYKRKQLGSQLRDTYLVSNDQQPNEKATLANMHEVDIEHYIDDKSQTFVAWIFEGNIFVQDRNTKIIKQVTKDLSPATSLQYFKDTGVAYRKGDSFYVVELASGLQYPVLSWQFAEQPTALQAPSDYIAQEQLKLIQYENVVKKYKQDKFNAEQALKASNKTTSTSPIYLDKEHKTLTASLSPDGQWAIIATTLNQPTRNDTDLMPDYIEENGRIGFKSVRQRVADAKPVSHELYLVNVATGRTTSLSYKQLPGYNEDVLADVKAENAKAKGQTYTVNRLPRDIGLLLNWYATKTPIKWSHDSSQVALMLEAWDNKDRWIVTVDPRSPKMVTQERMHDDAWVNYRFNEFGWFHNQNTLYWLSETSGYSHLYTKPLNGDVQQLTSGNYIVEDIYLSQDDDFFVYKANKKHPGIYEVYQYDIENQEHNALTDLNGMTEYVISPDESTLVLTHSKITMPPELYLMSMSTRQVEQVTHTVSDEFLSIDWVQPSIVAIPSEHSEQPIYARVYLPQDVASEKRRAVVFNHGAGYLQNAHLGWSGYFREFMFHSFLVSQGYVVLDMDYRASAGYGRDWRTAIYRHMGKVEIEDNIQGVNWLVENANVDPNRVGTYGGSYGGFLTFMALFTEPSLYQAGAALRPVSDWAHYNTPYTSNILNLPTNDPIAYERSSPIYFAEGLQKPLLINAPMVDDNVFFVDVVRLVQRLIELEKQDFETAIYPVEPHGFVQPSSWLDEYRRIYKLFEENL